MQLFQFGDTFSACALKMTHCGDRCGIPGLGSDQQRLRLVVMGDSFVGKSAIIKRFLFGRLVDSDSSLSEAHTHKHCTHTHIVLLTVTHPN